MKAFILNGFEKKDDALYEIISEHLKGIGWEINTFFPQDKRIAPCQGCFGCWIKTPGICVIDDAGRNVVQMAVQSDMIVFLSPVTFGGYSSCLKKAIDRMVPIALPFFMKIDGEIHHKSCYEGRRYRVHSQTVWRRAIGETGISFQKRKKCSRSHNRIAHYR
jgi:multimeric flavodoxin WrbA